jgi:hypothetical protein
LWSISGLPQNVWADSPQRSPTRGVVAQFKDEGGLSADPGHRMIRWSGSQLRAQKVLQHPAFGLFNGPVLDDPLLSRCRGRSRDTSGGKSADLDAAHLFAQSVESALCQFSCPTTKRDLISCQA